MKVLLWVLIQSALAVHVSSQIYEESKVRRTALEWLRPLANNTTPSSPKSTPTMQTVTQITVALVTQTPVTAVADSASTSSKPSLGAAAGGAKAGVIHFWSLFFMYILL